MVEAKIEYLSDKIDSLFARSLNSCKASAGRHFHALDGPSYPNDEYVNPCGLGFVVRKKS
jgi:hypothetical protein